jgi:pimeloyl-ACP methyl ester carboxylesterase
MTATKYRSVDVDGLKVFYREAGPTDAPVLLLLHGFPTASYLFRDLMPLLSDRYRLLAPDIPGFGETEIPGRDTFSYTFDNLTRVIERFTETLGVERYAMYVFDYGAPIGFRLAIRHPERVTAIISQNGNAYEEGLSDNWEPIKAYWTDPSQAHRDGLRTMLKPETTVMQYTSGVPDETFVPPDGYTLDNYYLGRPGEDDIQLDLLLDYATNTALYPAFQEYFRSHTPPLLAIWGKNDPFFLPRGAEAFKRDIPSAEITLLDTGHFALATHPEEIASAIGRFLGNVTEVKSARPINRGL